MPSRSNWKMKGWRSSSQHSIKPWILSEKKKLLCVSCMDNRGTAPTKSIDLGGDIDLAGSRIISRKERFMQAIDLFENWDFDTKGAHADPLHVDKNGRAILF